MYEGAEEGARDGGDEEEEVPIDEEAYGERLEADLEANPFTQVPVLDTLTSPLPLLRKSW